MISRSDKRKRAYNFIHSKLHELDHNLGHNTSNYIDVASIISLAEIDKLKRGYADPSAELVAALKDLLRPVAREREIENNLVKPFLSKSRLSK